MKQLLVRFLMWLLKDVERIILMTVDQSQLDALLDSLAAAQAEVVSDIQALLDRLSHLPSQDFAPEASKLQASIDALNSAHASVQALNSTPPAAAADQPAADSSSNSSDAAPSA